MKYTSKNKYQIGWLIVWGICQWLTGCYPIYLERSKANGEMRTVKTWHFTRNLVKHKSLTSDGKLVKRFYISPSARCLSRQDIKLIKKQLRTKKVRFTNYTIYSQDCKAVFSLSVDDYIAPFYRISIPMIKTNGKIFINHCLQDNPPLAELLVIEKLLRKEFSADVVKTILARYKRGTQRFVRRHYHRTRH